MFATIPAAHETDSYAASDLIPGAGRCGYGRRGDAGRRRCVRRSPAARRVVPAWGDAGARQYVGGALPVGSGVHNYHVTVTALDVEKTGLDANASAAYLGFAIGGHTIARTFIIARPQPLAA